MGQDTEHAAIPARVERATTGKFAKGNGYGKGNPFAAKAAKLRSAMYAAVTEDDIREIVSSIVQRAKDGDMIAAREVLDRIFGKASQSIDVVRLYPLGARVEPAPEREIRDALPDESES